MSENTENPKQAVDNSEPDHNGLNGNSIYLNSSANTAGKKPSVWVWLGLAGLLVIALLVIFVLPAVVAEYELPLERRIEVAAPALPTREPEVVVSPFEEAQRMRLRSEAQEVLAALLENQAELSELRIEQWGQVAYEEGLEQASIGDQYYREQSFELARDSYADGRDRLATLLESIPTVLSQTLIEAQRALEAGDAELASQKFELAVVLDPANEEANVGAQRATTLEEVTRLLASADESLEDGDLDEAGSSYQQALNLDAYNEYARQQLDLVGTRLRGREFQRVMSRGYALLEEGDPAAAIAAFEQAAAMGVNGEQARAAIEQTENEVANARINTLRGQIATAESAEDWQLAVDTYNEVLSIDPNLLFAAQGLDYAGKRAQLDRLLVYSVDNPERFAEDDVFQETLDIYYTGRAIENPGPRLQGQLDQLERLLENSQVPVEILLRSDNLTEVTLLRVGELGVFEQTSLSLRPGNYVAVGRRPGYREVREEFTVGFGLTPEVVVVQCVERVIGR